MDTNSWRLIELHEHRDERGSLIALEEFRQVPFPVKRCFYIYGVDPQKPRGFHAHMNAQEFIVCIKGRCKFVLDNGEVRGTVLLESPSTALYIGTSTWIELGEFSIDCILLVLCDRLFDDVVRIEKHEAFLEAVRGKGNHD